MNAQKDPCTIEGDAASAHGPIPAKTSLRKFVAEDHGRIPGLFVLGPEGATQLGPDPKDVEPDARPVDAEVPLHRDLRLWRAVQQRVEDQLERAMGLGSILGAESE